MHSRRRQDPSGRGPRGSRSRRFPAFLRVGSAAPVCRTPDPAGTDGRAERATPARARRVRLHFAVELPARDLYRPDRGRSGCRERGDRQAGRADAADRRAGNRTDAPRRHSARRRSACARGRPGRRGTDGPSTARRRCVHRLDRNRAPDQPRPCRPGRSNHSLHCRDRRPECDDRRQLGITGAGHPRRHVIGVPERRPALLGMPRAVRSGRCCRRHGRNDLGRDAGSQGRRPRGPRYRRRPGDRRGGEAGARRPPRLAGGERPPHLPPAAARMPPLTAASSRRRSTKSDRSAN